LPVEPDLAKGYNIIAFPAKVRQYVFDLSALVLARLSCPFSAILFASLIEKLHCE
jgi:hypothetical protein